MPEQEKMPPSTDIDVLLKSPSTILALNEVEKQNLFANLTGILKDPNYTSFREKTLHCLNILTEGYKPTGKELDKFKVLCEHDLKKEMEKLISERNEHWAKIWQFIVNLLGSETHGSKGLLNSLLSVLEKAMKSKDNSTLVLAFNCWSTLIDNFALNAEVLAAQRRVDLLTIPLKSKIAKDPETNTAKFYTWWHLIVKLKVNIGKHYDNVLKQFYFFCYGPFGSESLLSPMKLFKRVPALASDILHSLAFILGTGIPEIETALQKFNTKLETPTVPVLPDSSSFVAFSKDSIHAVADFLISSPDNELAQLSFKALIHRIGQLHADNESSWQSVMSELLLVIKNCLALKTSNVSGEQDSWETNVVEVILSTWNTSILDTQLAGMSTTPRILLLDMLLQERILLQNAKPTLEKHEDK